MIQYEEASEVEKVALALVNKFHGHLNNAKIKYLFRTGRWVQKNKLVSGTAELAAQKWRYLTGFDFIIIIHKDRWEESKKRTRVALLDHELCHCAQNGEDKDGNPRWYIEQHAVEEFPGVVSRHGLWTGQLRRLDRASKEHLRTRKLVKARE